MERREAARRVIDNPHPYYTAYVKSKHPEVDVQWIERTLIEPYRSEIQSNGRLRFWGAVPERGNWWRVIVDNGQLFNAFLDHGKRRQWGRSS